MYLKCAPVVLEVRMEWKEWIVRAVAGAVAGVPANITVRFNMLLSVRFVSCSYKKATRACVSGITNKDEHLGTHHVYSL